MFSFLFLFLFAQIQLPDVMYHRKFTKRGRRHFNEFGVITEGLICIFLILLYISLSLPHMSSWAHPVFFLLLRRKKNATSVISLERISSRYANHNSNKVAI